MLTPTLTLLLAACGDGKDAAPTEVAFTEVAGALHEEVVTLVEVSWSQDAAADAAWLEYTFEGDAWLSSPPEALDAGAHSQWLLGIPPETEVTWRVVAELGGERFESGEQSATTGALPEDFEGGPALAAWDPALASGAGWVLGSVDVDGGGSYTGPFWLFIADRQGRLVWWRELEYEMSMFPRVSRSGGHLMYETQYLLDPAGTLSAIHRVTLDGRLDEETPAPGLGWCWDELPDGTLLYDRNKDQDHATLEQIDPDGTQQTLWDCFAWQEPLDPEPDHCYTNTVNWVEETDTVLWSTYWGDYALEVDRATGEVLWYAGALEGGLSFDSEEAGFELQHYPNYTADGTLMISTHVPGSELEEQRANEYIVDLDAGTLERVWSYGEGVSEVWAKYSGEAVRLEGGNTLINYGTGGEIREVTGAGEVAWSLQWGDERTVGHTQLVADLYTLNEGR
jgi:hypothetical protein